MISIQTADSQHLPAVQALARRIWFDHYPGIISTDQIEYMLDLDYAIPALQQSLNDGVHIALLMQDTELIGFAAYGPTDTDGELKLHKLYVDTAAHGRGLGSMLLNHVEHHAANSNCNRIILQVNKENKKAIDAYLRNGYESETSLVVDIGHGFVMDDYLMSKSI